jgi:ankyrin repeat protein
MNNKQLTHKIKRYIRLILEDKIYLITKNRDKIRLLSKSNVISIINFMNEEHIYSIVFLEYIRNKPIYKYGFIITPFHKLDTLIYFCKSGNLELVKYLLSEDNAKILPELLSDLSSYDNSCIQYACENGHIEVVKYLLSEEIVERFPYMDPSANDNHSLIYASLHGHIEIVKFLLSEEIMDRFPKAQIDPSADDNSAIGSAIEKGHSDIVKYLLSEEIAERFPKAQIDPSIHNNQFLRRAVISGHTEVVKLLLGDQRVIKAGLSYSIGAAKMSDQLEILDLLIEASGKN